MTLMTGWDDKPWDKTPKLPDVGIAMTRLGELIMTSRPGGWNLYPDPRQLVMKDASGVPKIPLWKRLIIKERRSLGWTVDNVDYAVEKALRLPFLVKDEDAADDPDAPDALEHLIIGFAPGDPPTQEDSTDGLWVPRVPSCSVERLVQKIWRLAPGKLQKAQIADDWEARSVQSAPPATEEWIFRGARYVIDAPVRVPFIHLAVDPVDNAEKGWLWWMLIGFEGGGSY